MLDIRTFRAASMQEAMRIMRRELGEEAVVVNTRSIVQRRAFPWLTAKSEVEVIARVEAAGSGDPRRARAGTLARNASEGTTVGVATTPSLARRVSEPDDSRVLSPAQLAEHLERELLEPDPFEPCDSGIELSPSLERLIATPPKQPGGVKPNVAYSDKTNIPELSQFRGPVELNERLDSIQRMLESLNKTRHLSGDSEVPPELFQLYTELLDSDVEEEVARDLLFRVRRHVKPEQLHDHDYCKSMLTGLVESDFRTASPIKPTPGRRRVVALVGPTGVGKTTTIAKLAANFRLRDGIRIGLVTVDTFRVAAVEQLRTYAEIIDLPMKVVTSPLEMRRVLDELVGLDLILIDTGGRSPRDELKIQELKALLAEAQVDEVHLVLSLTAGVSSLRAACEKFATANTSALILTKLDEAAGMGSLMTAARKLPLPVSYLTTGQDVPDDIECANASRMARLVLGQEKLET
ncbi:MAG: flagellar biosynthesis protein FlhF [Planctomycetaceae bacterium]|nr:flagellar biosynthesis protein FlhF [Planctomycetaceae bacterium]